ncbi:MAG: general secretion pathway protein GspB [Pseudomonadota bacterium]
MSFILDALKKSESERKRQGGPALLEMRVSAPRRGLPLWAVLIGVALLANLAILAWLLLRQPTPAVATPVVVTPPAAAPLVATPGVATPPPAAPVNTAPATVLPDPATVTTAIPAATDARMPSTNAADYEPAVAPRVATDAATVASDMGLPTMQDLNAGGAGIPPLRLSLHAYDPNPANRYVLLNASRLREGESTPEGVRLERITEFGAVLSWRGRRFTLQRGE